MWLAREQSDKKGGNGLVAVAIDKDKGSQNALKWAVDNLLQRGQTVILVHVKVKSLPVPAMPSGPPPRHDLDTKELFLPFRCFCTRKDIQCKDVLLEDTDVAKALIEYVSHNAVENLVVGSASKSGFLRTFKTTDVPSNVAKGAPDFCTVYVITKGKITTMRSATRLAPMVSPLSNQIHNQSVPRANQPEPRVPQTNSIGGLAKVMNEVPYKSNDSMDFIRSPFTRGKGSNGRLYGEIGAPDTDISFVSSGRQSIDRMFPSFYDNLDSGYSPRLSNTSNIDHRQSFDATLLAQRLEYGSTVHEVSSTSHISVDSERSFSSSSLSTDDVEAEMKRLKQELKQTMDMYSKACKEALSAKQKAKELQHWKIEEERRIEEARLAEEAALALAEKEKAKSKAAMEAAEAAQRIAELEAQKRINAEMKALKEQEEKKRVLDAFAQSEVRYRRYTIEEIENATEFFSQSRKIGEGGYGPVYKCHLDHTSVAIKVLRPDAAQGRSQFLQEVEVLSCIRHPNMVLLLGACPEYGCLVYEFMANGSLEDRLFRHGNTAALSWQIRFKIAAEIGTGLLFLHQAKPEPLVHRDLKPGNILLDGNYVSKISDVGLARLVPPSVADSVTQYRLTSTAGTFCYIDPEYQQTGMLGVKSDIYSLGIIFLQLLTARPPMGLTHHVERAIEKGTFSEMLDPAVPDWPINEALSFAQLAIKCSELRRKDRPDLAKVVLPELDRLRALAENSMNPLSPSCDSSDSPNHSQVSLQLGSMSPPSGASHGS
ncbi:U-box domain-containing protein 52 isoform X1 [Syzygium oleosum]|uniref:U-box domain-containing protein 52 isoform X1 n=1 Tax=Syzygium oleosum TaxID=219896 RepID=UPI0024B95AD2|nr:U-box domain-containing protein 52 isoform X1 [Syzygium oleosum]